MARDAAKWVLFSKRDWRGRKRWHWKLVAPGGGIVATSTAYDTAGGALLGIEAVRRYSPYAQMLRAVSPDGA